MVETHQTLEVAGVRFRAYAAGHVLGACMFMVEVQILVTPPPHSPHPLPSFSLLFSPFISPNVLSVPP